MATTAVPATTAAPATTAPAASSSASAAWTSSASATPISAAIPTVWPISTTSWVRTAFTIEVRLTLRLIRKIPAAFDHQRSTRHWLALDRRSDAAAFDSAARCRHLRALLFQNRLARQPDPVAFHCQHLHQHLIAFFQLVADIGNTMLRHFADVQQTFGARNDLDERAEIRQPRDFPEISLPYLGGRRDVADNLQRLRADA